MPSECQLCAHRVVTSTTWTPSQWAMMSSRGDSKLNHIFHFLRSWQLWAFQLKAGTQKRNWKLDHFKQETTAKSLPIFSSGFRKRIPVGRVLPFVLQNVLGAHFVFSLATWRECQALENSVSPPCSLTLLYTTWASKDLGANGHFVSFKINGFLP